MALRKKLKTLREIRKEKGMTLADIFKETKIWMATLSGIENGYFNPDEDKKKKIAKFLRVKVDSVDWGG